MAQTPPLNFNLPMVNPQTGVPTPFFMRWWQEQIQTNGTITNLSTTAGVSGVLDVLGATQGDILYRDALEWKVLPAGTANRLLRTNGAAANPSWAQDQFVELSDTPSSFTSNGKKVVRVNSGATALEFQTIAEALEDIGSTQGSILYHNGTTWVALTPGTSGHYLETKGSGANPVWSAVSGGGGGHTFSGAFARSDGTQSIASGAVRTLIPEDLDYDTEVDLTNPLIYDSTTGYFHVPASWDGKYAEFTCGMRMSSSGNVTGYIYHHYAAGGSLNIAQQYANVGRINLTSGAVEVAEDDYFRMGLFVSTTRNAVADVSFGGLRLCAG